MSTKVTRRQFLGFTAAGAALFAVSCAPMPATPAAAPKPTEAPPTEVPAPAAPPAAPAEAIGFDVASFSPPFDPVPDSFYAWDDMTQKHTIKWMRGSWYRVGMFPEVDPIKKYIDKVMNVDFQLNVSTAGVFQDINLMVASGEGAPDVWWIDNLDQARKLVEDGVAIPDLMPYVKEYCPNYLKMLEASGGVDRNLRAVMVDGKMVAFARPTFTGEPGTHIFVRKDWASDLGIAMPKTTDDLFNAAKSFREKGAGKGVKYGFSPGWVFKDSNNLGGFEELSHPFGAPQALFREGNNLAWGIMLPGRRDFLAYVKQFIDAKLVPEDWYLWYYPEGFDRMNTCDWAIAIAGAWGVFAGGSPRWSCFPQLEFVKWVIGKDARWGLKGETTAIVSEQLSAALLKDEAKLKRVLHIIDKFANPRSNLFKATYHRPYEMDPEFENWDCIVKGFQVEGDFIVVEGWAQGDLDAMSDAEKERCPWLKDEKQRQSLGEWRPIAVSVWSKLGYTWAGAGKLEDSVFGGQYHMKDYYYKWWAELADQQYYDTVTLRGDPAVIADLNRHVWANELKFVLGQRPLSEWDAYVNELITKYKGKELLQASLKALQDAGDPIKGIDPRIPL